MELKYSTSVESLCRGLPNEFSDFLVYSKSLRFDEKPDYDYLRGLIRKIAVQNQTTFDFEYDWNLLSKRTSEKSEKTYVRTRPKYHRLPQPLPRDMKQDSDTESDNRTIVVENYTGPEFVNRSKVLDNLKQFTAIKLARHVSRNSQAVEECILF